MINLFLIQSSVRATVKQGRGRGGRLYVLRWWYYRSNIANCYYIISSWKIIRVILFLFLIGMAGRPKLQRDNPHLFKSPTDRGWTGRLLSYAAISADKLSAGGFAAFSAIFAPQTLELTAPWARPRGALSILLLKFPSLFLLMRISKM